jgi:glycosyltransferase involved in cell wall biosynthesis
MLTDDVAIDRRILQEAKTLEGDGHQIILLAGHDAAKPSHEMIGETRVERLVPVYNGRREELTVRVSAMIGHAVNALSARSQSLVGRANLTLFGVLRRVLALAYSGLARVLAGLERRVRSAGMRRSLNGARQQLAATQQTSDALIDRTQSVVGKLAVTLVWRFYWVLGMVNHRGMGLAVKLVRRTRLLPVRDEQLAKRAAYYRPDVVHAHDLPQMRGGLVAARRLGVPFVYDAHELYPEIGTLTERQQQRLGRLERRLMPKCDVAITVNPHIAAEMSKRYRVRAPEVILNAIDPVDVGARHLRFHELLGLAVSDRVLLFQGWMSPTRGLDLLIDALARTEPVVHLVLMGYGDMADDLIEQARRLGVEERVHIIPAVPQDELLHWTQAADAGVIPYPAVDLNHRFCSPNKLFEFIQAGLPIVANDLPFLRDVVGGEGIGRLAPIEDPDQFARAIDEVIGGGGENNARCRARIAEVADKYSWRVQGEHLREIYSRLDATAGAGRRKEQR